MAATRQSAPFRVRGLTAGHRSKQATACYGNTSLAGGSQIAESFGLAMDGWLNRVLPATPALTALLWLLFSYPHGLTTEVAERNASDDAMGNE
jgi:hypothetical protein